MFARSGFTTVTPSPSATALRVAVDLNAVDRPRSAARTTRYALVTLVVAAYIGIGFALGLAPDAYLLIGIPITVLFQVIVARRPIRALWVRHAPPFTVSARSLLAAGIVAIAPSWLVITGLASGSLTTVGYGIAAIVGAGALVYAIQAMDRDAWRTTLRTTILTGSVLVGATALMRLVTGAFTGTPDVMAALSSAAISVAMYLPAVFVLEEVLFRGALDPYLHGSTQGRDRASALYGSALWGVWHLPLSFAALGFLAIPYLMVVHGFLGYFLVGAWRRTGNLAAPAVSHAVIDALRNAVIAL